MTLYFILMKNLNRLHRSLRRFMSPSFGIKYLQNLEPMMEEQFHALNKRFERLCEQGDHAQAKINLWMEIHNYSLGNNTGSTPSYRFV